MRKTCVCVYLLEDVLWNNEKSCVCEYVRDEFSGMRKSCVCVCVCACGGVVE